MSTAQDVANTDGCPGRLLRRVPGPARPRREVLDEVEAYVAERRQHIDPVLASLLLPDPRKLYRWKVELECGHVDEVLTIGPDRFPDERRYHDNLTQTNLNAGEMWCRDKSHWEEPKPYRDIREWVSSKVVDFEADPIEPKDGWDPDTWKIIRHDKPTSSRFWRVLLACGHHYDHVVTDVDWTPDSGPKTATVKRAREMKAEMEEYWATDPEASPKCQIERAHMRKMIELRWPRPTPEQACCACAHARQITGYQRIGWLVPPPKPAKPAKSQRELLEEQVARAETEARRLRARLDELD